MTAPPLLDIRNLTKTYPSGLRPVLRDISLSIRPGEFIGLIGLSGAGKSTFLRCINRLIEPTSGQILVPPDLIQAPLPQLMDNQAPADLVDITALNKKQLRFWRRKTGMIFQQFNIVKRLKVIENVLSGSLGYIPAWRSVLRLFSQDEIQLALVNLERVGLLEHAYKRSDALSGGEQQRVAIARTLMQKPRLILADEPVASLDPKLSRTVLDILKRVSREDGIATLVSLHTLELTREYSDRVIGLAQGEIAFDDLPGHLTDNVVNEVYERYSRSRS